MCVSPISIPNPNYGRKDKLSYLFDTESAYIRVPCGVCDECLCSKQMQLVQRVIMESTKNHLFFATLTYDNEHLPIKEVNGYKISFADYKDLNNCIRRIRHYQLFPRAFRYFAVSEFGSKRGRPHFHVLFLVPKFSDDDYGTCITLESSMRSILLEQWKRNYGSRSHPRYESLCTYVCKYIRGKWRSNYDLHYVNPNFSDKGVADVGFYVLKYMLKPSYRTVRLQRALRLNLDPDEYESIWSEVKPRFFKSHDFGLATEPSIIGYLRDSIEATKHRYDFPVFVNPINGSTMPLSRFYKSKGDIYDVDTATYFAMEKKKVDYDDPNYTKCQEHSLRKEFLEKISDSSSFDDDDTLFNF